MKNKQFNYWKVISSFAFVIGLFIGIFIGMYLMTSQIVKAVDNLRIENLNIGFNESKIIEWANQTINKEQQDPEWMYYAPAMNFTCFGMSCSPTESIYIKGVGVCYNKSEGIICPV